MNYSNDPYKLKCIITSDADICRHFVVYEKKMIPTFAGLAELAVIGSSHYLKINNSLCEALTAWLPDINKKAVLFEKEVSKNASVSFSLKDFHYSISINIQTHSPVQFSHFEKQLLGKKCDLQVSFGHKTAITALKIIINSPELFCLKTWHTYPECNVIVESETLLKHP